MASTNPLRDLLLSEMQRQGLTLRGVHRRARVGGKQLVALTTLSRIYAGHQRGAEPGTIEGLAYALNIPVERVQKAVEEGRRRSADLRLPERFADLPPSMMRQLEEFGDYLLSVHYQSQGRGRRKAKGN